MGKFDFVFHAYQLIGSIPFCFRYSLQHEN